MTDGFLRATTWALLIGYVLVSSGLPLPLGGMTAAGRADPRVSALLAAKDRSRNFPCRDKPCGCGSAEQCFASCCCHTPAELAAWAESNRVAPDLLAALARRAALPDPSPATPSGCCGTPAAGDSCCAAVEPSPGPCHDSALCPAAPAADASTSEPAGHAPRGPHMISLRAMLACGGVVSQWLATASAPPPPRVVMIGSCGLTLSFDIGDRLPIGSLAPPDAPPPRPAA